jgi:hypothetical protein
MLRSSELRDVMPSVLARVSIDMLLSIVMLMSMELVDSASTHAARLVRRSALKCMMGDVWWSLWVEVVWVQV